MSSGPGLIALANQHYKTGDGSKKPTIYWVEYEELFGQIRNEPVRILELGVQNGSSLLVWHDYFPNAMIVGLDISKKPELDFSERVYFVRGSQDDPKSLEKAAQLAGGKFDIIIDDASHIGYLTRRSFLYLFPKFLKPGGYYVIEDYGTSFLSEFPDGEKYRDISEQDDDKQSIRFESHQNGMIGVIKQLIDVMMRGLAIGQPSLNIERITLLVNIAFMKKGK